MAEVDIKLSGYQPLLDSLLKAQPTLAKYTKPALEAFAKSVQMGASGAARPHPSGLWRKARMARYNLRERGPFYYRVETPGGKAGRALTISEFARTAVSPRGGALVAALNATYGAEAGGRILYRAHDRIEPRFIAALRQRIALAEAAIERQANG